MQRWVDSVWAAEATPSDVWRVDVVVADDGARTGGPGGQIIMARNGKELHLAERTLSVNMLNYCGCVIVRWREGRWCERVCVTTEVHGCLLLCLAV